MTIRNNDYSKNDTFDEALLERDIDLSRIGVQ